MLHSVFLLEIFLEVGKPFSVTEMEDPAQFLFYTLSFHLASFDIFAQKNVYAYQL